MRGMQDEHVLACAKHFPGHGDTATDSHQELPMLDKTKEELIRTELYPFRKLFDEGLGSVMIAHLQIPQLENDPNRASTLSKRIVTGLLKEEMGFGGLIITDALDMHAVADHYAPGKVDIEALLAGNDILLFVKDVPQAIVEIKKAIHDGRISKSEIGKRCLKQLMYKYWLGLHEFHPVDVQGITEDVNKYTTFLNERLFESSLTLVHGNATLLMPNTVQKTHVISLFADGDKAEQGALSHHTLLKGVIDQEKGIPLFERMISEQFGTSFVHHNLRYDQLDKLEVSLLSEMKAGEEIVLAIHDVKLKAPENFGITNGIIAFVSELLDIRKVHLVFFGNPYALAKMSNLERAYSILLTYQENEYTHKYAAQTLLGQHKPVGKLPVDINKEWPEGFSQ